MKTTFENFCPRLRPGRVIPKGAQIIFETDNPYNQIILPMALADLVLLCNGHHSLQQIIERFYNKRGTVPFKSILKTIHALHQSGFFENGHELSLNTYLSSWMEPRLAYPWTLSWRFGQRIIANKQAPTIFYILTLLILAGSIWGIQAFPEHPIELVKSLFVDTAPAHVLFSLLVCSSVLQSMRHLIRGIQLLLLTGKIYNVGVRLDPWGLHLHIGDEANDLFESQLYTSMFHLSQILLGWGLMYLAAPAIGAPWLGALIVVNLMISFWELNPFVQSEGLRLIRALTFTPDREVVSWHYDSNSLFKALGPGYTRQDHDFAKICGAWGSVWLLTALILLLHFAATFSIPMLTAVVEWDSNSLFACAGIWIWFFSLYSVSQAFVENIVISLARPILGSFQSAMHDFKNRNRPPPTPLEVLAKIQDLPLFSHFSRAQLLNILSKTEVTEVQKNVEVVRPDEELRELYVLIDGEIEIVRNLGQPDEWSTCMQGPSIFSETALLDSSPQPIHVKTLRRCVILEMPVNNIKMAAEESQAIRQLKDFRNAILVSQFFASSPVFRSLSQTAVDFLCSRGKLEYFEEGQIVFRQGDVGDSIFLVLLGSVDVDVNGSVVNSPKQGSFFGEISLIANIPRTGTVKCREASVFFRISAEAFWEVLVQNLDLGVYIETISEQRLRDDLKINAVELLPTGSD